VNARIIGVTATRQVADGRRQLFGFVFEFGHLIKQNLLHVPDPVGMLCLRDAPQDVLQDRDRSLRSSDP
jgi:hypothetical protein